LGKLTLTPALFEPFRNPVTANEIRTCTMKLFAVHGELERQAKREAKGKKYQTMMPRFPNCGF